MSCTACATRCYPCSTRARGTDAASAGPSEGWSALATRGSPWNSWDKPRDKLGHETKERREVAPLLAPAVGLEPTTKRLTVARSTN